MTPVSVTAVPTNTETRTVKSHNWYCCFNCKCLRRVSQAPKVTPTEKAVAEVYEKSINGPCPKQQKIYPREPSISVPELLTRDKMEKYFEPRYDSEIDVWFCTDYQQK